MNSKQIQQRGENVHPGFSPGDEVVTRLLEFARKHRLDASRFTGVGGSNGTLHGAIASGSAPPANFFRALRVLRPAIQIPVSARLQAITLCISRQKSSLFIPVNSAT